MSDMKCSCGGELVTVWGHPFRSHPSGYVCRECGVFTGFHQAVIQNAFPIQQMPPGALPTYDKDPDIAAVVISTDKDSDKT